LVHTRWLPSSDASARATWFHPLHASLLLTHPQHPIRNQNQLSGSLIILPRLAEVCKLISGILRSEGCGIRDIFALPNYADFNPDVRRRATCGTEALMEIRLLPSNAQIHLIRLNHAWFGLSASGWVLLKPAHFAASVSLTFSKPCPASCSR
jgi:hypothetical protein